MKPKNYCFEVNIGPKERRLPDVRPKQRLDNLIKLTIDNLGLESSAVSPQIDVANAYEPYDFLITVRGHKFARTLLSEINELKGYVAKFGEMS